MPDTPWINTSQRFIAFFDILGFKDLVLKSTHKEILDKLVILQNRIKDFGKFRENKDLKKYDFDVDQTKSVTFSDSFLFFSKGNTLNDVLKILLDSYALLKKATEIGIAIKGAISFGEITVDFENSLFYGQPIIDAYLLHEELIMLTAIVDHNFEIQLEKLPKDTLIESMLGSCKANLRSGKITHQVLKPSGKGVAAERILILKKMYKNTSGKPRIYIDNTIEFYSTLLDINKVL